MTSLNDTIAHNLAAVRKEIDAACVRCGRDSAEVTLVAVTKYAEWPSVQALAEHHNTFGENRPQQLAERAPQISDANWHLIGQLQRNKVRLAVQHSSMIHSVDSLRLLSRIGQVAAELHRQPEVLLQVNVSGEDSKSGFIPVELVASWKEIVAASDSLRISGLMTMAPATNNAEEARPFFAMLRRLRDKLRDNDALPERDLTLPSLSMGMSGDFAVAIEEGATHVRIGSRLFSGL